MDEERLYKLLARELAGELSGEEAAELHRYPEASYIREVLAREWKARGKQYDKQQLLQLLAKHQHRMNELADIPGEPVLSPKRNRWIRYAAIAASIITILALVRFWPQADKPVSKGELALFTTNKGARSQVMLPDGSKVWLNAGSRLNYAKNFTAGNTREVSLEGEAFFIVTADANRPFFVHTNAIHIKVLGTSFNVRAYPGEDSAVASLVLGSVAVAADEKAEQGIILRPNEKLVVPVRPLADKSATEHTAPAALPAYKSKLTAVRDSIYTETAWVQNKLAFKHLELEKVAEMLEQWYGVEIGFRNEKKKQLYFTGVFDNETLVQVMNALETTLSFTWSKDTTGKIWIQ